MYIIYITYINYSTVSYNKNQRQREFTKGAIRQGCLHSPMLFNIYVKQPIKEIWETLFRNKIGVRVGEEPISYFRFPDNIVLLTNNEHDMERALEEIIDQ